ncbi:phosphate ABC transporter permease [Geothermobacter hydrogeniphilus]|uniref:Transport permease protein n=1 Tax=Geothermobacter hydrogeniphilus TaxID=1969733 RepID=A0A2K2H7D0_9BACT|nr:phosphate ABC transporter permease [Geothermobacter hydrogeniphilus]
MDEYDLVIEAGKTRQQYWLDLWRYRELFLFMAWRDILVRYKQTVIGVVWSVLRPLLVLVVFTVLFDKIARLPSEGDAPYPILVLAALLPWQLFSGALTESSNSLIINAGMITKVYFPRVIMPASAIIVCFVDFLISFVLLLLLMVWYHVVPGWHILALPVFLALAVLSALGGGLWLSALNVKYRDFRLIIPFIVQFGLYVSPVGFSSNVIPDKWRLLYSLNPMVGVIDGFRWSILGKAATIYWPGFLLSLVLCVVFFWAGFAYFRKAEKGFADVI